MTIRFFAKPDTPDNEELQAFFDNFDLIQQHKQEIYANPEYYNIRMAGCGCFPLYVTDCETISRRIIKTVG